MAMPRGPGQPRGDQRLGGPDSEILGRVGDVRRGFDVQGWSGVAQKEAEVAAEPGLHDDEDEQDREPCDKLSTRHEPAIETYLHIV
jgi:hypothetical protein